MPGSVTGFAANRSTLVTVPTNQVPTSTSGVVRDPAVRVVDISGDVITALRSKAILEKFKYSPDASVSPDGSRLALTESFKGSFAYIDLRTGRIDPGDAVVPVPCRASWHSDSTAAIFAADGTLSYVDGPTRLRTMPTGSRQPRVLTVVDPRIIAHCLHLTRAALAGPAANGEFLGVRTGWWTWRWRELGTWAIGSLVFLLLIGALMRRQLRRRRDRLT